MRENRDVKFSPVCGQGTARQHVRQNHVHSSIMGVLTENMATYSSALTSKPRTWGLVTYMIQ